MEIEEQPGPPAKRQRGDAPPPPSLEPPPPPPPLLPLEEVSGWLAALDEPSTIDLFEFAVFTHLEAVIAGRPHLRDALLSAFVQRHPASNDRDPAAYCFTDDFLLEAVEDDFDDREQLWDVLGRGNEAAVHEVIATAASLDRLFCAQLQSSALLSRARRLLASAGASGDATAAQAAAQQLEALMQSEQALALARGLDGRSLWHDLAAGGHADLLGRLLPLAAAAGFAGNRAEAAAGGQEAGAQQQGAAATPQAHCLNLTDAAHNTALHLAAGSSQLDVAQLLLDFGACVDMQNRDTSRYARGDWSVRSHALDFAIPVPHLHQTPLHLAAEAGDLEMMQLLVARGALLDLRDTSGSTPLHLALEAQDVGAVELLLAAGANPTLANHDMGELSSPLHAAAGAGQASILRLLLGTGRFSGGTVSQPGEQGFTPLHLAARRGSKECVALLLEHGADYGVATAQGKTALDIARINRREAVTALLEQRGGAANGAS